MVERARLLALKQPGRVALFPGVDAADERLARGAADAILLGDDHDRIGRAAGLALLYGTLPIAPEVGANRDYLVDYDARSRTGHAILYGAAAPFEIESAVRRALTLAGGRRRLGAAGEDADDERAALVGRRRVRHRDRRAVPGGRPALARAAALRRRRSALARSG